jgi:hypothetical protein
VFRYLDEPIAREARQAQPTRIVIAWRYEGHEGMPPTEELDRMGRLEALLEPAVETPGIASLVLVSTGSGVRAWTYYARSEASFLSALNRALAAEPRYPVEIDVGDEPDPDWRAYQNFKRKLRVTP